MITKLKGKIKALLQESLIKKNRHIQPLTVESNLKNLIHELRPVKTDKKLIRLGPDGDGGYLVIDDLRGIEACFSPGVDTIAGFEEECALKYEMKIFMADKSVDKPPEFKQDINCNFIKKFIGLWNNEEFITLDNWVNQSAVSGNSDLTLQMDIEGSEYLSLLNLSEGLQERFRVMVIEFHNLDKLWIPEFFEVANSVFEKLLRTHYCVHLHPNNYYPLHRVKGIEIPKILEFTFHRKDRLELMHKKMNGEYPHPLDRKNVLEKPDLVLPELWQNI